MAEPARGVAPALPWQATRSLSRAASATAWVTIGWMLAGLPALLVGAGSGPRHAVVLAGHIAMLGTLALAVRSRGALAQTAVAWLPLAAIPLLYAELPYLIAVLGAPFGDQVVQQWEHAIWGGQPARGLASSLPYVLVSEPLHLAYLSYYAIIYAPLAWLWLRATRTGDAMAAPDATRAFAEASLGVIVTFVLCFAVFVAFPVQGPRYLWPSPAGIPDGPVRGIVLGILERGSSRGAAFPSSHMAVAVVQAFMALHWRVPGRLLITMATIGLGIGAVYGGFHYAVDMLAGAALGAAVFAGVRWWSRKR